MPIRVRIDITWIVQLDPVPGAWHQPEDFVALARRALTVEFPHYRPVVTAEIRRTEGGRAEILLAWDVNLDGVPGAFHEPEDYVAFARHRVEATCRSYTCQMSFAIRRHVAPGAPEAPGAFAADARPVLVPWEADYRDRLLAHALAIALHDATPT